MTSITTGLDLNLIRSYLSPMSITYAISHNYAKIKVDSYDSRPLEKTLNFHVIIPVESVFNKDKNNYYCNIFLEKCLNKIFDINKTSALREPDICYCCRFLDKGSSFNRMSAMVAMMY